MKFIVKSIITFTLARLGSNQRYECHLGIPRLASRDDGPAAGEAGNHAACQKRMLPMAFIPAECQKAHSALIWGNTKRYSYRGFLDLAHLALIWTNIMRVFGVDLWDCTKNLDKNKSL